MFLLVLTSSTVYNRNDSKSLLKTFNFLTNKIQKFNKQFTNVKTINVSVNEAGVKYINNFKSLTNNDLQNSLGTYFINNSNNSLNMEKLLNIKLLNYKPKTLLPTLCLEQNTGKFNNKNNLLKKALNISNYINLPNNSFYEKPCIDIMYLEITANKQYICFPYKM